MTIDDDRRSQQTTSFRVRLTALMVAVGFIAALFTGVILAWVEVQNQRHDIIAQIRSNLDIVAFNLAPAVMFDDYAGAQQLLGSMHRVPNLVAAEISKIDPLGHRVFFTGYGKDTSTMVITEETEQGVRYLQSGNFLVETPIVVDGDTIGYLAMQGAFDNLSAFLRRTIMLTALVVGLVSVGAFVIAWRVQRVLMAPINNLVEVAQRVRETSDFTVRARVTGSDEFASLGRTFNRMLAEIQAQTERQKAVEQDVRALNQGLEDKIRARTREVESTNLQLRQALDNLNLSQRQMVEREKMASLGELVAGVAHEVNTPVGIGVTATSHLASLVATLEQSYQAGTLTPEELEAFMGVAKESLQITATNLDRAADLVRSFKRVAVDQTSDQVRSISLKHYLHEVLMSLRPQLKRVQHHIHVDCPEGIEISCNAGALSQVLTNLLMNSLQHAFEGIAEGNIYIALWLDDESRVHLDYRDDGVGMSKEMLPRLFDPFFTTRRGQGGSGLGTHVMYNLVTQALGGDINVRSELGQGLKFTISFPQVKGVFETST